VRLISLLSSHLCTHISSWKVTQLKFLLHATHPAHQIPYDVITVLSEQHRLCSSSDINFVTTKWISPFSMSGMTRELHIVHETVNVIFLTFYAHYHSSPYQAQLACCGYHKTEYRTSTCLQVWPSIFTLFFFFDILKFLSVILLLQLIISNYRLECSTKSVTGKICNTALTTLHLLW
jgi:hypothetical protein